MRILTDKPVLAGTLTGIAIIIGIQIVGRVLLAVMGA